MQKVKDVLHLNKDKSDSTHAHAPTTGSGLTSGTTSEKRTAGGVAAPGHTGGHTSGHHHSGITGVGAGANQGSAQTAADEAARQGRKVNVNTGSGVATGKPVHDSSNVTGVGAGTNESTAKHAANEAAHQGRDVGVNSSQGQGTGRPVQHAHGTTGAQTHAHADANKHADGSVIDRKYHTGTEARHQDEQLVERFREHNPYAKEYETTVQHTGRERQIGHEVENRGSTVRTVGADDHFGDPHAEIHRNLPKGAINERPAGEGWVEGKPGPVCDSNTFTVAGNRPVVKERVTNIRHNTEHEKEFEVATRLKGEHATAPQQPELLGRDKIPVGGKDKIACEGHPDVGPNASNTSNTGGAHATSNVGRRV